MTRRSQISTRPAVRMVGDVGHADFRDAVALLRSGAELVGAYEAPPELIVVAQSRPGSMAASVAHDLRRSSPLAGIVTLAGSWCEGEVRTGQPWTGVTRLYWYEFPAWWARQVSLRIAGQCPDWAQLGDDRIAKSDCRRRAGSGGLSFNAYRNGGAIAISSPSRDAAHVIADVLRRAGYVTVWCPRGRSLTIRGAAAGIWDGGQLSDREVVELSRCHRRLAIGGAPVIVLLDFPRRDRVNLALELGAAAVLGKPWRTEDLVGTVSSVVERPRHARAA